MKNKVTEKQTLRAVLSWLVKRGLPLSLAAAVLVALTGCPSPTNGGDPKPQDLRDNKNFTIDLELSNPATVNVTDARTLGSTDLSNLDPAVLDAIQEKLQNVFDSGPNSVKNRFDQAFIGNEAKIYIRNSGMDDYKLSAHYNDAILWHEDFLSTREAADADLDIRNLMRGLAGTDPLPVNFVKKDSSQGRALEQLVAASNTKFMVTQGCLS